MDAPVLFCDPCSGVKPAVSSVLISMLLASQDAFKTLIDYGFQVYLNLSN